jgi:hypothetical protein
MLARTGATIAESWLAQLEAALAGPGRGRLKELFHPDSHWRDALAKSARRFADELRERIELMRKRTLTTLRLLR